MVSRLRPARGLPPFLFWRDVSGERRRCCWRLGFWDRRRGEGGLPPRGKAPRQPPHPSEALRASMRDAVQCSQWLRSLQQDLTYREFLGLLSSVLCPIPYRPTLLFSERQST